MSVAVLTQLGSSIAVLGQLVELARPYRSVVLPLFFFGFFLSAFTAIRWSDREFVRRAFVVGFFTLLVLFNTVAPVTLLPFVSWAHFAQPVSETVVETEIRVVDENGKELKFDDRATLDFQGVSSSRLARAMLEEYDEERNERVTRHLLREARAYREEVGRSSWMEVLQFPNHGLTSTWTSELLEGYDEFVGLRIYRMTVETSPDGTEIESYEEEILFELFPNGTAPERRAAPNTTPPTSINRTAPSGAGGR